ncbi:recombinase family protein [Streptomyces sp. NPDC005731]|uniref:recombinase family protein n=1 Tax=Streptomyces sp. NPDC005731 TaxID=3157056 RepID=UPI0033FD1FD2
MTPLVKRGLDWTPNLDHVRAVSYIRQSRKREDDSASSPEAQRTKCEALITAKGWDNAGHFADVGKSGWDPKVVRPEFEEMMSAVRAGRVDTVVVFSLSRLTRQGALEAMLINEELARHGVLLVSVEEPYLDTSTPMGVAIFGLIAALAQQESDMKSAYITATKETLRAAGSHVSGMAPYGFQSTRETRGELVVVKLVPDPAEAPYVRDMVSWALSGMTASAMARKLNTDGVPTKAADMPARVTARQARGVSRPLERTTWVSSTVLRILRDPRLAGYAAERHGTKRVILRDNSGAPLAAHEGIVPVDDWWRLQDVLDGRTPQVVRQGGRSVPSLLGSAGMLFCEVCGSSMVTDKRNGKPLYRCNRAQSGAVPGHGGLAINMDAADDVVARTVWSRLTAQDPEDPEDLEWLAEAARRFAAQGDTGERQAELAAARAELEHVREALRTLYVDRQAGLYAGAVGDQMFRESVERLTAHEERTAGRVDELATAEAGKVAVPSEWTAPEGDPLGPESTWAGWDLSERREFLALFVDRVSVARSVGRGRNANTAERVAVHWAEAPAM